MRQVIKIQTFDGKIHDSQADAKRHLDALYADELCRLAHKLTTAEKYSKICEVLNDNLNAFSAMLAIKADFALIDTDREDL